MYQKVLFSIAICISQLQAVQAQDLASLRHLKAAEIDVYYSDHEEVSARFSGDLCAGADAYFKATLEELEVPFQLLVLSEADWPVYTNPKLIYGMPHYKDDGKSLVVAAEDNMFWRMQLPDTASLKAPYKQLFPVVYNLNGEMSSRYFFDLLAVHELGHAWHWAAKLNTQRKWLSELYCNIMLHTYIAEERDEFLGALQTLPSYWAESDASGLKYTTLRQFEDDYNALGLENPFNYGWYQFRFHSAAN